MEEGGGGGEGGERDEESLTLLEHSAQNAELAALIQLKHISPVSSLHRFNESSRFQSQYPPRPLQPQQTAWLIRRGYSLGKHWSTNSQ